MRSRHEGNLSWAAVFGSMELLFHRVHVLDSRSPLLCPLLPSTLRIQDKSTGSWQEAAGRDAEQGGEERPSCACTLLLCKAVGPGCVPATALVRAAVPHGAKALGVWCLSITLV